ncbi:putative aminopeptidase FrvX [Haloferula luteola]|uniref:Putative aminopeptidase FrvX n=1 Tax=Haloferula luteola TaxID=595692 RepID=A0A840V542_9BACT|nr:peptidase M42 [Haloferula luteola]MBB5349908.1 putative aminopeptidase FrvX [Haloferula luteola]
MSSSADPIDLPGFLETLRHLVREPSVVGTEDSFFRVLRRELEELDIRVERHLGILVAQGSEPDSLILSAHVDRHGLLCTGPNEFQYAAFIAGNRGELSGDSVSEQMMASIAGRFDGQRVQAHMPYTGTYLGQGVISNSFHCPKRHNLIFEINGLEFLQPGSPVSFLDRLQTTDTHLSAQLDNVLSVALILHLFRLGFQGTALFTAQEEAARSWRYALAWFQRQSISTRRLLVLDTSPYPTPEAASEQEIVLRWKDATASFDPGFTEEIARIAHRLTISTSFKDTWIENQNLERSKPLSLGRTELGRLVAATGGCITGTTLQIPTTGYHTTRETASFASIRAAIQLLSTYLNAPSRAWD